MLLRKLKEDILILVESTLDLVIRWITYNDLTVMVVLHMKRVAFVL